MSILRSVPSAMLPGAGLVLALLAAPAAAQCECRCVNNKPTAWCQSLLDIPPACAPQVCEIERGRAPGAASPFVRPEDDKCKEVEIINARTRESTRIRVCR
jgi:hypothetical protein